ncbi:hypothetical protein [Actinoplanes regularis]|uniref:hypothetical protein n=1 Tax=Actinoplanes regularis TaxID=52697 RepID=UPI00255715EE|nr:hypothetical protein [Actinoplanes regularis]
MHEAGEAGGSFRVVCPADRGESRADLVEFDAGAQQHEVQDQTAEPGVTVLVRVEEGDIEIGPGSAGRHRDHLVGGLYQARRVALLGVGV